MNNKSKWNFTLFAPNKLCSDLKCAPLSNIIIAFIKRGDNLPADFESVDQFWLTRRHWLQSYIFLNTKPIESSMKVCIFSEEAKFTPLFHASNESYFLSSRNDCPVLFIEKELGIAAFVATGNDLRDVAYSDHKAIVQLIGNGLIISEITFSFEVTHKSTDSMLATSGKVYETIFASYAREDKLVVESIESIMQAFGLGEHRWDLRVLRAGDDWQKQVYEQIQVADSFQLFWSEHARKSKNVRKEWEYALELNRKQFIKPVYWRDPLPSPPKELSQIHFSRIQLMS